MTKAIKRSHFRLQAIAVVDDGGVADFRGIRAAASLKRSQEQEQEQEQERFPRHSCRGLIEALKRGQAAHATIEDFRGIRAAASLKLCEFTRKGES